MIQNKIINFLRVFRNIWANYYYEIIIMHLLRNAEAVQHGWHKWRKLTCITTVIQRSAHVKYLI